MLNWRAALLFPLQEPGSGKKIFLGGLWILLCPPIGWSLALGYRKEFALRLVDGEEPVLPSWKGLYLSAFFNGCKAIVVTLYYFTPFLLLFWLLAVDSWHELGAHIGEIATFFAELPFLIPVTLPGLPIAYARNRSWIHLSVIEIIVLVALFFATTAVLPAAFMQVSLYRKFRYALSLSRAFRLILAAPKAYLEAWIISLAATGLAIVTGPLMPWSFFWSYLAIGFAFNNALMISNFEIASSRFARSKQLNPFQYKKLQ